MSTINERVAAAIMRGEYEEDEPVMLVRYNNIFSDELSYGLICLGDPLDKYKASIFVMNPEKIWSHPVNFPKAKAAQSDLEIRFKGQF